VAALRSSINIMWKRKEDEYTSPHESGIAGSSAMPVAPAAPPRPAEPVRSDSVRGSEIATIGKSVVVKGELSGSEDLIVDGEVEGSITLRGQSLTVGPNGRVDGDIHATERVELRKSASLTGDIATARISIEDGAFFKGGIDIQKPEATPRIEAKPQGSVTTAPVAAPITTQGSLLESKKL
jgi:cytoskeletal protein CcmA (bactofilin family)